VKLSVALGKSLVSKKGFPITPERFWQRLRKSHHGRLRERFFESFTGSPALPKILVGRKILLSD
jgi:hypothetical protein